MPSRDRSAGSTGYREDPHPPRYPFNLPSIWLLALLSEGSVFNALTLRRKNL